MAETIRAVEEVTVRAQLSVPIRLGDWMMKHREFALVRVRAESGPAGHAFTSAATGGRHVDRAG
jgi:hypothetical protein